MDCSFNFCKRYNSNIDTKILIWKESLTFKWIIIGMNDEFENNLQAEDELAHFCCSSNKWKRMTHIDRKFYFNFYFHSSALTLSRWISLLKSWWVSTIFLTVRVNQTARRLLKFNAQAFFDLAWILNFLDVSGSQMD